MNFLRRRCEARRKSETKIEESIGVTSDGGFQTDEESPKSEPTVQPGTVDDGDVPPVEDRIDDGGRRTRIGSDKDISSDTDSNLFDRPVTESATEWAWRYSHGPEAEYWKNFAYPMTIGLKRLAKDYRYLTENEYSLVVKALARGMMMDWAEKSARTIDQGCRTDEESPSPDQTIESVTAGDNVYTATLRDDHFYLHIDIMSRPD